MEGGASRAEVLADLDTRTRLTTTRHPAFEASALVPSTRQELGHRNCTDTIATTAAAESDDQSSGKTYEAHRRGSCGSKKKKTWGG